MTHRTNDALTTIVTTGTLAAIASIALYSVLPVLIYTTLLVVGLGLSAGMAFGEWLLGD